MANLLLLLLLIGAMALAESYRRRRLEITVHARQLTQTALASAPHIVQVADVPAPVARYLKLALGAARPPPRLVRIAQEGALRTDVSSNRWYDFRAENTVAPLAQAFLWNAKVRLAPLIHLRVLDALLNGIGRGRVQLMSTIELASAAGLVEINAGSLHRFLAEAVWYPWALMPSEHLAWTHLDDRRALATLTVSGLSVSLEFRFGVSGEVTGIYTPARWGRFGKRYLQAPWEGEFREYRQFDGLMLPSEGAVGWHWDGKLRWVWSARVDAVVTET
jgi:hypothetical protein